MAKRTYNGQLYQAATTEWRMTTTEGFDFRFQTWEDGKLEATAEGKVFNNADGSVGGWTLDVQKFSGSIKIRLDEYYAFEDKLAETYDEDGVLQVMFDVCVTYGNSVATLRKDYAKVKINKISRDLPKSQDALMVELPLMVTDFVSNGHRPVVYPQ